MTLSAPSIPKSNGSVKADRFHDLDDGYLGIEYVPSIGGHIQTVCPECGDLTRVGVYPYRFMESWHYINRADFCCTRCQQDHYEAQTAQLDWQALREPERAGVRGGTGGW